jgi:hypothetical protein
VLESKLDSLVERESNELEAAVTLLLVLLTQLVHVLIALYIVPPAPGVHAASWAATCAGARYPPQINNAPSVAPIARRRFGPQI